MDAMSKTGAGHQREGKVKKRGIQLYAGKDNKLAILPRSTFRGEEMRGREEKSKKRTNEQIFEAQWRLAVWKKSQCISHRNSAGMRWLLHGATDI